MKQNWSLLRRDFNTDFVTEVSGDTRVSIHTGAKVQIPPDTPQCVPSKGTSQRCKILRLGKGHLKGCKGASRIEWLLRGPGFKWPIR